MTLRLFVHSFIKAEAFLPDAPFAPFKSGFDIPFGSEEGLLLDDAIGGVGYLAGELTDTSDPKGGYFNKGGTYMPSLVAEIGCIVDRHLQSLGLVK